MTRIRFFCVSAALGAFLASGAYAAPVRPEMGGTGCSAPATVADLASYAKDGALCQVQDGASSSDCAVGSGSEVVLCCYDGSAWAACGGGAGGGSGDVTGVGDCTGDECFTISGGTGNILYFEGTTVDGNDTTFQASDPGQDNIIELPDESGTICTDGSVCTGYSSSAHTHTLGSDDDDDWFTSDSVSNVLIFEGSITTDDAYEGTLAGADFSADRTLTLPDQTGTICVNDSSTSGCGNITNSAATTDDALMSWSGTGGKTAQNTECVMSDIDGDGSNDYISCPEGYTSGDQGCANNTDCNVFALAKNAGGGTPTCTTMEAGNSNLLDKLFLLPKSDDSVVLCDGGTEIGTVAVASAGDVTAVGAGCSSGACLTDGVLTSGTTVMVYEGTAADAEQYTWAVTSAEPAAAYTFTWPDETGTVCTTGSVCTGYQAEMTGASDITTENVFAANEAAGGFDLTTTQTECVTLMASGIVCLGTAGCTDPADVDGTNFSYRGAAFATDADDIGSFTFKTPLNMSGTTAAVRFAWISNNAACNNGADDDVCWTVDGDSFADDAAFNSGALAGTEVGTSDRCTANGDVMVSSAVTFTHSMSPDETAVLNIRRDTDETVGSCSDDYGQSASLIWAEFCYEVDNLNSGEN